MTNGLERLRSGSPVFAVFQTYPDAAFAELAAWSGLDFLILDCEHGVTDEQAQLEVLRAVEGSGCNVLVRIREASTNAVGRYLDLGASGILVPDVRSGDQAALLGRAATARWTEGLRGDRYGLGRKEPALLIALIETMEGVSNVDAILTAPGIDGVIVGSGDLSVDLGSPGVFDNPAYLAAVETVRCAAIARGKILGAKPYGHLDVSRLLVTGHRFIILGRDVALIRKALADCLAVARLALESTDGRK